MQIYFEKYKVLSEYEITIFNHWRVSLKIDKQMKENKTNHNYFYIT